MTSWGLQVAKRFKAAKREMYLGSAEMTEESKAIFDEKTWRSLLGVVAKNTAAHWAVTEMPKRWSVNYAQTYLGKRNLGADGVPFFEVNVANPRRRWIAMAEESKVSGGARGKSGGRVIKAAVKHRVPNIVKGYSIKAFSTIPTNEARNLGTLIGTTILEMSNAQDIKSWRREKNRKTRSLLASLRNILKARSKEVNARGTVNRQRSTLIHQGRLARSQQKIAAKKRS